MATPDAEKRNRQDSGLPTAASCPYCGEPKDRHEYASRTSCVLGAPKPPAAFMHEECDQHEGEICYPDSGCAKCEEEQGQTATCPAVEPVGIGSDSSSWTLMEGDSLDLMLDFAVVLREAAQRMERGSWAVIFAAASWRSTSYMVDAVRGILDPVRIGTWVKPESRTKVATSGWRWASVNAIAFRKGKSRDLDASTHLDHITAAPVKNGRRAELPPEVALWAVAPFAVPGGVFLDPFAGSGMLPRAAAVAGMRAYGFERSPLRAAA